VSRLRGSGGRRDRGGEEVNDGISRYGSVTKPSPEAAACLCMCSAAHFLGRAFLTPRTRAYTKEVSSSGKGGISTCGEGQGGNARDDFFTWKYSCRGACGKPAAGGKDDLAV